MLRGQWSACYRRTQDERTAVSGSYATSGGYGQDPTRPVYAPPPPPGRKKEQERSKK